MATLEKHLEEELELAREENLKLKTVLEGFVKHAYDEDTEQRIYWEQEARTALLKAKP